MSAVTAACEAAMQKLNSISIAGAVQLTDRQLEDISQLRSDYLTRYVALASHLAVCILLLTCSRFQVFSSLVDILLDSRRLYRGMRPRPSVLRHVPS